MPPNQEARQPGQSTNQAQQQAESARQIQEQLEEEIRAIADNELEKRRLAKNLSDAVKDAEVAAGEQRRSTQLQFKKGTSQTVSQTERQALKKSMVRLLKGVEQGIVEVPSDSNKAVLLQLNQKIGTQMSENNVAFLQPIVSKLLESNQTAQDLQSQFEALKQGWGGLGPELVDKVAEALVATASEGKLSVNEEQARDMFKVESEADQNRDNPNDEMDASDRHAFDQDWSNSYRNFFGDEDLPVLEALYSVDSLSKLIESTKERLIRDNSGQSLSSEEMGKLVSEDIRRQIVLTYSNIYSRTDRERADKTFDEIEQEGSLYNSIRAVDNQFKSALQLMVQKIRTAQELPENIKSITFYGSHSIESLREKKVLIDEATGETKMILQSRIIPVIGIEGGITLADFLSQIHSEMGHEYKIRKYLHNINSLFLRPAGEGGFWGQLGNFSEQLRTEDVDTMMLLPDSDKFTAAYRLYVKYLEEDFAKLSWIHQPGMFADDFFKNNTILQQRLLKDLKMMFPELAGDANNWRLRRAMSFGIGLAKGVMLSEPEIAASADPHLGMENGRPTFTSMYTNDGAATEPLNPLHAFLRWQAESMTAGPLIYLPVENLDPKMMRHWDHKILWENMKKFRDSFVQGRYEPGANRGSMAEKLFVDILPNIGKGGSIITRGGWRIVNATEGWMVYDASSGKLDVVKSFKALENIGYEAVKSIDLSEITSNEKNDLYSYLYQKYISKNGDDNFANYISNLRDQNGKSPADKDKFFMNSVYAHMIQMRMPTKFVRLERDRTSERGQSLWKLVRKNMPGGIEAEDFDNAMKNLAFVEVAVRNRVSMEMKKYLGAQSDKGKDLSGFVPSSGYSVTEESINTHLAGLPEKDRAVVIELLKSINTVVHREGTLGKVADTLSSPAGYPFALGAEEIDMSLLAMRNAGPRVMARALKDTGQIETIVYKGMKDFLSALHPVSISANHDFSPLVKSLHEMKHALESVHGHGIATKVAHHMAGLAIAYFKKDALAKNIFTKVLTTGKPNSLAAEFAGTYRGVWEWEVADVDNFITTLERDRILPKNGPFDLGFQQHAVPEIEKRRILGIPFGSKIKRQAEKMETGDSLRKDFGATKKDIALEYINKFLPALLAFAVYSAISKTLKEEGDKKH